MNQWGLPGLQAAGGWTHRTKAEKLEAVFAYLESDQILRDVCKKLKIRSTKQLRNWIKNYNGHEKLKSTSYGGGIHMTKGRTVTFEEKANIVQFCIASVKDYAATIATFKVSYQ